MIIFEREFKDNDIVVTRKQEYKNNQFIKEEYEKRVNGNSIQKTNTFVDSDNTIYFCSEFNNNPQKICQKTNYALSFLDTDLVGKNIDTNFILYDKILENLETNSMISSITIADFKKKIL